MRHSEFLVLFTCLWLSAQSQRTIHILDSSSQRPIIGAAILISHHPTIFYSDLEGRWLLRTELKETDTLTISSLGYERIILAANRLSDQIVLAQRRYILPPATIRPIDPKNYIQRAFDSFYSNHLPISFSQRVFYREEFIMNDHYARFQEMNIEVYQFAKPKDKRKYYLSGSYPKVHQLYRKDDSLLMGHLKGSLGRVINTNLNFNYLSGYSNAKGVNVLNYLFTNLLDNPDIRFEYLGIENVKGYQAIHIRGQEYKGNVHCNTMDVYLEENSYAVLHYSKLAVDENLTRQFIDFKTRTLLWLLGVRIKVNKYYTKLQFAKAKEGFWVVDDFMMMLPVTIHKKKKLDLMMNIGFRMNPSIITNPEPLTYRVYQDNQFLFDHYKGSHRFADKLNFSIPTLPSQLERLGRMK